MNSQIDDLVVEDPSRATFRVHRSTMTSHQLFVEEQNRIFSNNWLYLGHESEVSAPGDYQQRIIAGRSIMFIHGRDDVIRAFFNTCPHRGANVCRREYGNAHTFQCFYHAWTYNTEGELVGVPGKESYPDDFDFRDRSLASVPRLDNYRGFYFLSFKQDIMELEEYLAGAKEYLDVVVDAGLGQGLRVVPGTHKYSIRANWKLLCENSIDGYHAQATHHTYLDYISSVGGLETVTGEKAFSAGGARSLGNGHTVIEYPAPWGRPVARWVAQMGEHARDDIDQTYAQLVERYGPERAERIGNFNRNLLIYPNLIINDIMAVTVRTFYPSATGAMDVTAWAVAPVDEADQRLQGRLRNFLEFLGPGGFATPDDVEALESCQVGFEAGGVEYNDVSRGMNRAQPLTDDELQMRVFWRQWQAQMAGRPRTRWEDPPVSTELAAPAAR